MALAATCTNGSGRPAGITYAEWRNGKPWKLPLVQEIRSAISAVRTKRKRDGTWRDAQDRLTPQLLVIACVVAS